MNNKRITINLCSVKNFDWFNYNHTVMLQAVSPDTIACSFWGGCIKLDKRDVYPDKIEKTARVIEAVTKCILQNNVSLNNRIAFCCLMPAGGGYREYCWIRLFMAGFFKNKCIRNGITIDFFSKSGSCNGTPALNEYLPKAVIRILNNNDSCIVHDAVPKKKWEMLIDLTNAFIEDHKLNDKSSSQKNVEPDLKRELIKSVSGRKKEIEKAQKESVKFDEYLESMYERKARQEIQCGNYKKTTTEDEALGGWKRKFHGELYAQFDDKNKLIKARVNNIIHGKSLENNRLLLLYICYRLSMSFEEVRILFDKGKMDTPGKSKEEAILLTLIDKGIKEDNEAVYYMLANFGYFDLYEMIDASITEKEEVKNKKKRLEKEEDQLF